MANRKKSNATCSIFALILAQSLILSCASKHGWAAGSDTTYFMSSVADLHKKCRLKPKSGFTADLVISGQGTARIEAVWDTQRQIQGQILNPIGEDLLNFKIDDSGLQLVDHTVQAPEDVLTALDFLAQMGIGETRALLCSGLFLTAKNIEQIEPPLAEPESEREIELPGRNQWYLSTRAFLTNSGGAGKRPQMRITTEIKKTVLFWKKQIATVDWQQGELSIRTQRLNIRLSFLDFE